MQSPNPRGRKPIDQDVKRALQAAHPQAVARLVEIMTNPKSKTSDVIRCIEIVIERNRANGCRSGLRRSFVGARPCHAFAIA
jgi:hypothetical protein